MELARTIEDLSRCLAVVEVGLSGLMDSVRSAGDRIEGIEEENDEAYAEDTFAEYLHGVAAR